MRMEGWVKRCLPLKLQKCLSQQNTFGVSGLNSVSAKSDTIEVNVYRLFKHKKTTEKINASILLLWCHPSVR